MSNVLNRTSKEYLVSVNTPDYSDLEWIINPDLSLVTGVDKVYWKINPDDTVTEMSDSEKAQVDLARLPELKEIRITAVDARTDQLIEGGFEFPPSSGKRFSLNVSTRTLILGMVISKDSIPLPVRFNTMDESDYIDLQTANDIVSFYGTALMTMKTVLDSGTDLKALIRAAPSKADLDAIHDPR